MILQFMLMFFVSWADTIDKHKKEVQSFSLQAHIYEKRLEELKSLKMTTPDGPELEDILSEIADVHKELLQIRSKREKLKEHLRKEHPNDLYSDLSFYKQDGKAAKKEKKVDLELDKKLDSLLKQVQSQYVRTLSEDFKVSDDLQTEFEVREKLRKQRAKTQQEEKARYIKEDLKSTIKTE